MLRWVGKILVGAVLLAIATSALAWLMRSRPIDYGVTFSTIRTEQLNLDVGQTFSAILDDLKVKKIRIPIYWSEIEKESGVDDWSQIDYLMSQAREHQAEITLAIGLKVPRWPECFAPDWTLKLPDDERDEALLAFMARAVTRFRADGALERWQVENEPLFNFGECPRPNLSRYLDEVALVRRLDPAHPILVTTSGEQSWWGINTYPGDILGATLYRFVANDFIGPVIFPMNELFYLIQGWLARLQVDKVIISELQGEAWNDDRNYDAFTVHDLERNAEFVSRIGVDEVYWWGVEWWYYLKVNEDSRLWDAAKEIFLK